MIIPTQRAVARAEPAPRPTPEASAALAHMQEAMRQGRAAGDSLKASLAAERKGRAKAAIERLEQQISRLATMAVLSPKALARMIRQLERQLANAVSEYAKAGGQAAPASGASAPNLPDGERPEALTPEAERQRVSQSYRAVAETMARAEPDRIFARKAESLHQRLKDMFEGALARIEDERERDDNRRAFAKSSAVVQEGLAVIDGWGQDSPVAPLVPGSAGLVV